MSAPNNELGNVHGTALVLGQRGLLIRGPSGAGKSLLALDLLEAFAQKNIRARLVADDRVELEAARGAIVMTAPASIAGLIELRGRGVVARDFVRTARLDLVVDLVDELERLPAPDAFQTKLGGVTLPRCPIPRRSIADATHQRLLVEEALRALETEKAGMGQKTA